MSEAKYVCDGGKLSMSTARCTAGPCTVIVQNRYIPCRCMLFDDRRPAWKEVKADDTAQQSDSEPQVETTPETPTIKDNSIYEQFKGKFVPRFDDEAALARSLGEADTVEQFLAGLCSRFHVLCGSLDCEDCLMSVCESRELRKEWLESKGLIQTTQPTDSSGSEMPNIEDDTEEKLIDEDAEAICAAATVLEDKIRTAVGFTATPQDIVNYLRRQPATLEDLYALVAIKLAD